MAGCPISVHNFVLFSDSYFNGEKVSLDFNSAIYDEPGISFRYYNVVIRNASKEYYQYVKTFYLQYNNSFDPFAQPVQVESNVQNGYGIFAGYTRTVRTFELGD